MPAVQLPSAQHPAEEEARVCPSDSLHSHRKNDAETHAEEKEGEGRRDSRCTYRACPPLRRQSTSGPQFPVQDKVVVTD